MYMNEILLFGFLGIMKDIFYRKEEEFMRKKALEVLKNSALFKEISEDELEKFLNDCKFENFGKKKVFLEKDLKRSLYILIEGSVKSYQINPLTSKEYIIFLFRKGDVFDIITFVDEREHEVIFETLEDGEFVKVSHEVMDRWIEKNDQLNKNLIYLLSNMLQNLEQDATDLALYDTLTRLARLILRNISSKAIFEGSKVKLNLINKLSHENIANMIGSVREVVSRHMKTLKEKNVIETSKSKQHIIDLKSLIDFCDSHS